MEIARIWINQIVKSDASYRANLDQISHEDKVVMRRTGEPGGVREQMRPLGDSADPNN